MRFIILTLLLASSTVCWAAPITYGFHGVTTSISTNVGDLDPLQSLVKGDGTTVTNGDSVMHGEIIFDPLAWYGGDRGFDRGEVFSWKFSTLGLDHWAPAHNMAFHYIDFDDNRFSYLDELPQGGYGPDVATISFDFDTSPFVNGPAHFPVESFSGGHFGTVGTRVQVDGDILMYGLEGVITKMWKKEVAVPEPSSLILLVGGLLLLGSSRLKAVN